MAFPNFNLLSNAFRQQSGVRVEPVEVGLRTVPTKQAASRELGRSEGIGGVHVTIVGQDGDVKWNLRHDVSFVDDPPGINWQRVNVCPNSVFPTRGDAKVHNALTSNFRFA